MARIDVFEHDFDHIKYHNYRLRGLKWGLLTNRRRYTMSRIAIPAVSTATGATADVYAQVRKIAGGGVPNLFAALGHLAPATLAAALNAEGALASSSLSKQDLETIKLLVSEQKGCSNNVSTSFSTARPVTAVVGLPEGLVPRSVPDGLTHTLIDLICCLSPDLSAGREHRTARFHLAAACDPRRA
jgi:hypothetical protein